MRLAEYDTLRATDVHHWWYAVLRSLVERTLAGRRGHLLDAGCGTGGMLESLRSQTSVTGIDISEQAVSYCHQRGLHMVELGCVESLPFADETFDVVLSLDVLYHAQVNEKRALAEMCRVLRPEG
ncbi:MAG: Methyltransferase type 11, partial [Prosthecobacter sp.]|nr:Methyltransferase type 11 [Prosthecobacter sp.]